MALMPSEDGNPYRAFVCQTLNQWGYPAKDRSGRLDTLEEPHLGRLLEKNEWRERCKSERTLEFVNPSEAVEGNTENA